MSEIDLPDEAAVQALATRWAPAFRGGGVLFLRGDLGAGKTTFARALLQALGVGGRVKSPTYSLIESYRIGELAIHHLDLYRIADSGELEWLGLADLLAGPSLIVVEWPERGADALPRADLVLELAYAGNGRRASATAATPTGQGWLAALDGNRVATRT